jgi:uncharacterized protein YbbK (DUF523 family)
VTLWRNQLFHNPETASSRPLFALSACLLGEQVRYDGTHKLQASIERHLAPHVQLQAICPEVGIGLGVPRPTLKMVSRSGDIRVVATEDSAVDHTDALRGYADQYLQQLGRFWPLCAWVFKARSPSCGYGSSPVDPGAAGETLASGAFAARISQRAPWLLISEEEELQSEQQCTELVLLSFLARDILWNTTSSELSRASVHYQALLSAAEIETAITDRIQLWQRVKTALEGRDNEKRRELVNQYRAA